MKSEFNQKVSVFKNTFDKNPAIANLGQILEGIKNSPKLKALCGKLRVISNLDESRIFKQVSLPAITVSGTFHNGHAAHNQISHSGLLQADFDGKDLPHGVKLPELILRLQNDPYTGTGFLSPSGSGYKVFVKIPAKASDHTGHFRNLERYYRENLNLKIDPSCKDIGRLCFLSSDESIFINKSSDLFNISRKFSEGVPIPPRNQSLGTLEVQILGVIEQIDFLRIDITESYQSWLKIGFALSAVLGESGRHCFHRLSQHSRAYSPDKTDKQYSRCVQGKSSGITIRSFFGIAKSYGININPNHLDKY